MICTVNVDMTKTEGNQMSKIKQLLSNRQEV